MLAFPKLSQLLCLALSFGLIVSCTNSEVSPKPEAIPEALPEILQETQAPAKSESEKSRNKYEVPPKPPLPEGVDVAVDCESFAARMDAHWDTLMARGWCGRQDANGDIQIDQLVIDLLSFTEPAPAWRRHSKDLKCFSLYLSNEEFGFAYIRQDGRAKFAPYPYDAECQPFGNGVFIEYVDGLAVYTDEDFKPVKETNYVLADGFSNHLSKVCRVKPEKKYDSHGEHFEWMGGQCGYIGTDYKIVEPVIHAYENTPRPTGGKYDGDDATGREARKIEALEKDLPEGEVLEAVFLKNGCNFQSPYGRNPAECDEQYPGLPQELYKEGNHIREIHLRTERQNYYRGLVVYNGRRGFNEWEREIYWKSLTAIEPPIQD